MKEKSLTQRLIEMPKYKEQVKLMKTVVQREGWDKEKELSKLFQIRKKAAAVPRKKKGMVYLLEEQMLEASKGFFLYS